MGLMSPPQVINQFNAADQLVRTTNAVSTTRLVYDELGRRTQVIEGDNEPQNRRWVIDTLDAANNVIQHWDENNVKTKYGYDALNRKILEIRGTDLPQAQQVRTDWTYSLFGAATQTTSLGTTKLFYDRLGRLYFETKGSAHGIKYYYDASNNRTQVSDRSYPSWYNSSQTIVTNTTYIRDVSTQFTFDPLNRQISIIDSGSRPTLMVYDALGRVSEVYDRDGRRRLVRYDELNRLIEEEWQSRTNPASPWQTVNRLGYLYDATDNLLLSYEGFSSWSDSKSGTWRERNYHYSASKISIRADSVFVWIVPRWHFVLGGTG